MNLKSMGVEERFREVRKLEGAHVALEFSSSGIEGGCDDAYVLGAAKPWLDGNSTGVLVYRDSASHKLCVVSMARVTKIELLYRPGERPLAPMARLGPDVPTGAEAAAILRGER